MSSKINISGYDLSKTQIGTYKYQISVFCNDKPYLQFNVSLQPTGKDDILPTYQLTNKSQIIPEWITPNLNIISTWLVKEIQ